MRTSDAPFLADWFAISLRWLALLGISVSIALAGQLTFENGVILLGAVLWNAIASILAVLNRRLPAHRFINVTLDMAAAGGLFWYAGGILGPISWVGLLALFSASIYYEWKGSLLAAVLLSGIQAGLVQLGAPDPNPLVLLGLVGGFNLLSGLILGVLSRQLIRSLRTNRNKQLQIKREAELTAQHIEHERLQAFYNLTATLSATLNYQRVMDTALDLSVQALNEVNSPADKMVSAVLLFSEDVLQVGSSRRLTPADHRVQLPGDQGVLAKALQDGGYAMCQEPSKDPELCRMIALRVCQTAIVLPLRSGLNLYGAMLFAHPDVGYFNPSRCDILESISHQAVIAIQNARLYQALEQEKKRMIETQEEASKKLARDLHDGPTQSVAAIAMRVNFARRVMEKDVKAAADELVKIEELARRTTKEIRHMLFTLRPLVLESEGLVAALNAMSEKVKETFDQNVVIEVDPRLVEDLEINKQTVVFYISEEAANNARKHAQAAHIWVRLKRVPQEKEIALLEIADDGIGFDVNAVKSSYERRGSLGMINLQERSELVNGLLHIDSAPGKGTRVQVFIPLSEAAADKLHHGY